MHRYLVIVALAGCVIGDDPIAEDDEAGETGFDSFAKGNPNELNIGFNDGHPEQFAFYDTFFSASSIHPGPRLCHAYFQWDVAEQAPHAGAITDLASRAFVEDWLAKAQGHCDDVLVSFKSHVHRAPPATSAYADAFEAFAATNWAALTGYAGTFSFTPWNEPNNGHDTGNGLGDPIDARVAARYYLAAERSCRVHHCTVAAGDLASNGSTFDDFANGYLDRYKDEIVARTAEFGLPAGFRPTVFAYHGWHDSNTYLDSHGHCATSKTCTLRRVLDALSESWSNVVVWNTEDGLGQFVRPTADEQACEAAFLLRLSTISRRLHRLYITRLQGGVGELITLGANNTQTIHPALGVLARRQLHYANSCK